ncbi:uncharacterized protein LOC132613295 [Lycium barbarum]|uniref:uncharacterized protein LOC132613295 n=1 Tax=Lycium barbarum TaxID=112863 RepID=UPI00293EAC10|nr:uncharacterized protein LOC132613295 [Lycium barbarum]
MTSAVRRLQFTDSSAQPTPPELTDYRANRLPQKDTPYMKSLEAYVTNTWKGVKKPQILAHDEGYYIFIFDSVEDCEKVLNAGPYTFDNKPFVIQKWTIDFQFELDCLTTIPLWVVFPGLPVGYWSIESLSKVASAIGRPRYTDTFTAKMEKIAYARILYGHLEENFWHNVQNLVENEFQERPRRKRRRRNRRNRVPVQTWEPKGDEQEGGDQLVHPAPTPNEPPQEIAEEVNTQMEPLLPDTPNALQHPAVQTSNAFEVLE